MYLGLSEIKRHIVAFTGGIAQIKYAGPGFKRHTYTQSDISMVFSLYFTISIVLRPAAIRKSKKIRI